MAEWVFEDFLTARFNSGTGEDVFKSQYSGVIDTTNHWFRATFTGSFWNIFFVPYPYNRASPTDNLSYSHGWIKSGPTWVRTCQRLRWWWRPSISMTGNDGATGIWEWGIYIRPIDWDPGNPAGQGQHYYSNPTNDIYANQWILTSVNWNASHRVTEAGATDYPVDVEWVAGSTATPVHFMDGLTDHYFGNVPGIPLSVGNTFDLTNYVFYEDANSPDHHVRTICVTHNGSRFHVWWEGIKNFDETYSVYYSPTSMKAGGGLGSGTLAGSVSYSEPTPYNHLHFNSAPLAVGSGMWWAIKPASQSTFAEVFYQSTPYLLLPTGGGDVLAPAAPTNLRILEV